MTGRVVVVGSLNVDVSLTCETIPAPGETVLASAVRRSPGGKGANQAVAAALAGGASTSLVGAVGDDADGRHLLDELGRAGVDTTQVAVLPGQPSGLALITVDHDGENAIVVARAPTRPWSSEPLLESSSTPRTCCSPSWRPLNRRWPRPRDRAAPERRSSSTPLPLPR